MVVKVLTLGQIFKSKFLMNVHILGLLKPKIKLLEASLCAYIYYQYNSKQSTAKYPKFNSLDLYHIEMLLGTFYEDQTNILSTHTHTHTHKKKTILHMNFCA